MIRRIVKMEFREDKVQEFQAIFNKNCEHIRNQPGCHELILLQDKDHNHIFFTYSLWTKQEALDKYRNTELFGKVWKGTKLLFSAKPAAWSCEEKIKLS